MKAIPFFGADEGGNETKQKVNETEQKKKETEKKFKESKTRQEMQRMQKLTKFNKNVQTQN